MCEIAEQGDDVPLPYSEEQCIDYLRAVLAEPDEKGEDECQK